jgi:hypothetical protein
MGSYPQAGCPATNSTTKQRRFSAIAIIRLVVQNQNKQV